MRIKEKIKEKEEQHLLREKYRENVLATSFVPRQ